MDDTFDVSKVNVAEAVLFDHRAAQSHAGASIFWMRKMPASEEEEATVEHWELTRSGKPRGIVALANHDTH